MDQPATSVDSAKPDSERDIFLAAIRIGDIDQREAFLESACKGQADLKDRVSRLIAARSSGGLNLLQQAVASSEQDSDAASPNTTHATPHTGRDPDAVPIDLMQHPMIGAYKLLELIGEGGMGNVYLAQQSSPVRRKVALKIIKPGMDSRQVVARFEAERQALAMMEHPNIAKVLDAGTTDSGLPYFVMELVRGIPITDYCDRAKMSTRGRLELFCDACAALQHAHNKGVIHRDIKPSNILVTEHDGTPVVKVIDFGVAKALTDNLTDKTMFTGVFQMIGTPLYMSPEQASLSNLDTDVRSDVYSLGVMLYELVSGTLPIERQTAKDVSLDELRRQICETEPPLPSKRLSTLKDERETIAERRGIDARQLQRAITSEIDWIVMRAIEKDRRRRYQSARELADDVTHFLKGEAVEACPPSLRYRTQKFARRNRSLLVISGSIAVTLIAGILFSLKFAKDANLARIAADRRLEQSNKDFQRAMDAVDMVVGEVTAERFDQVRGIDSVRDRITDRAIGLYSEMSREHDEDRLGRLRSAKAILRLADLHSRDKFGRKRLDYIEQALAMLGPLAEEFPEELEINLLYARALENYGASLPDFDQPEAMQGIIEVSTTAVELLRKAKKQDLDESQVAMVNRQLAKCLVNHAMHYERSMHLDRAREVISESIELEPRPIADRQFILGYIEKKAGDFTNAVDAFDATLKIAEASLRRQPGNRSDMEKIYRASKELFSLYRDAGDSEQQAKYQKIATGTVLKLIANFPNASQYPDWLSKVTGKPASTMIEEVTSERFYLSLEQMMKALIDAKKGDFPFAFYRGRIAAKEPYLVDYEQVRINQLRSQSELLPIESMLVASLSAFLRGDVDSGALWIGTALESGRFSDSRIERLLFLARNLQEELPELDRSLAERSLDHGIETDSTRGWAHFVLGCYHKNKRNFSQAIEHLLAAERLAPDEAPWMVKRTAEAFMLAGQPMRALDCLRRSSKMGDDSSISWISHLVPRDVSAEFADGLIALADEVVAATGGAPAAVRRRLIVLYSLQQWEKAVEAFDERVPIHESPRFYYYHALACLMNDDQKAYQNACDQLLSQSKDSNDVNNLNDAAWTWALHASPEEDDGEAALKAAQSVLLESPENPQYLNTAGAVCFRMGDETTARKHLRAALALNPHGSGNISNAYPLILLALLECGAGNLAEANLLRIKAETLVEKELAESTNWNRRATLEILQKEMRRVFAKSLPQGTERESD